MAEREGVREGVLLLELAMAAGAAVGVIVVNYCNNGRFRTECVASPP